MSEGSDTRGARAVRAWRISSQPLLATALVSLASLLAWHAIRQGDETAIRGWSAVRAREAAAAMTGRVQLFELAFDRMARRQEFDPDPAGWVSDADRYRQGFPALRTIAWHRVDHRTRVASPAERSSPCAPEPADAEAFWSGVERAHAAGGLHWQMGRDEKRPILCVYASVRRAEPRGEYFSAAADPRTTAVNFLPEADPGLYYRVEIDSRDGFAQGDTDDPAFREFAARADFTVGAVPVTVWAGPSVGRVRELRSATPVVVLAGGQLFALLLGVAVAAGGRSRRRAVVLAREIERRAEVERQLDRRAGELEVARDAARAASRAKSGFLANMSHEIRTPLNAVIGLTEVLLRSEVDEQQRDQLETVLTSSESLLRIINDILDFSKIEAGKLELEQVPFDLHDTVGDTLKSFAMQASRKRVELACLISPDLPQRLLGDPARLRQVLTNLVSNALKFTDRGEVVVRVEPEASDDSLLVHFSVRDTGIGIASDKIDSLFDSFAQADVSTTRRYGGSGLGLAISRQLVGLMEGTIGAESAPGAGSTFYFTARFGLPEKQEDEAATLSLADGALSGVRVLIVDDNPTNRAILEEVTHAAGMRPELAGSAREGLDRLTAAAGGFDPFALLLSDVHMPDVDGFGLVEGVRADSRLDGLQILFLTSAGEPGDLARCVALRVAARLMKPVKQIELLDAMARALGRSVQGPRRGGRGGRLGLEDAAQPHVPPLRILLAEDSLANQKVVLAMLDGSDHEVVVAPNGRRVVDLVAMRAFDIVLMDVEMPEMDGFEATAAIRAAEVGTERHLPIVAMTAHAMQGAREKCLAAGMDDYVAKPVRRTQLLGALARSATGGYRRRGQAAGADTAAPPAAQVDWQALLEQVGGRSEALQEIVVAYLEETRQNLAQIAALVALGDAVETRRRARNLLGAMRLFGAGEAQALARRLEAALEHGSPRDAGGLISSLVASVERLLPELERFVATGRIPD